MKISDRRGAVIVLVLFMIVALFILSSSFLTQKNNESISLQLLAQNQQARELAYSGLETVRVKLLYDDNFPPSRMSELQDNFSYTEEVKSRDQQRIVGSYTVECHRMWMIAPYKRLPVVVTGQVSDAINPVRRRLKAQFYLAEGRRGELMNLSDDGGF